MIERRNFLAGSAAAAGALGAVGVLARPATAASTTSAGAGAGAASPFRHGIASGDPLPDAVVLWTRVTPTADSLPGSGCGPRVALRASCPLTRLRRHQSALTSRGSGYWRVP